MFSLWALTPQTDTLFKQLSPEALCQLLYNTPLPFRPCHSIRFVSVLGSVGPSRSHNWLVPSRPNHCQTVIICQSCSFILVPDFPLWFLVSSQWKPLTNWFGNAVFFLSPEPVPSQALWLGDFSDLWDCGDGVDLRICCGYDGGDWWTVRGDRNSSVLDFLRHHHPLLHWVHPEDCCSPTTLLQLRLEHHGLCDSHLGDLRWVFSRWYHFNTLLYLLSAEEFLKKIKISSCLSDVAEQKVVNGNSLHSYVCPFMFWAR